MSALAFLLLICFGPALVMLLWAAVLLSIWCWVCLFRTVFGK